MKITIYTKKEFNKTMLIHAFMTRYKARLNEYISDVIKYNEKLTEKRYKDITGVNNDMLFKIHY